MAHDMIQWLMANFALLLYNKTLLKIVSEDTSPGLRLFLYKQDVCQGSKLGYCANRGKAMSTLLIILFLVPLPSTLLPELHQKHRWDCVILLLNSLQMAPHCLKNVQTP